MSPLAETSRARTIFGSIFFRVAISWAPFEGTTGGAAAGRPLPAQKAWTVRALPRQTIVRSSNVLEGGAGVRRPPSYAAARCSAAFDTRSAVVSCVVNIVVGYQIGTRAGIARHGTVADYHCSGAWNAIAAASVGARLRFKEAPNSRRERDPGHVRQWLRQGRIRRKDRISLGHSPIAKKIVDAPAGLRDEQQSCGAIP